MVRFEGSVARTLDFDNPPGGSRVERVPRLSRPRLGLLRGPDKYKTLERRRRAAQIRARHVLDLIDMMEGR